MKPGQSIQMPDALMAARMQKQQQVNQLYSTAFQIYTNLLLRSPELDLDSCANLAQFAIRSAEIFHQTVVQDVQRRENASKKLSTDDR